VRFVVLAVDDENSVTSTIGIATPEPAGVNPARLINMRQEMIYLREVQFGYPLHSL
jgi:hypothetical protein